MLVSKVATVGRLPDPYRLDGASADGRQIWQVERQKVVMNRPEPDWLRPYIEAFLRESPPDYPPVPRRTHLGNSTS
nr:MAG TPA: hypothetical protein [Caudoviricetes sp.]